MGAMTMDPNVLMTRWMKIYLNLSILRSTDPEVTMVLDEMKDKLAECNEWVMRFFDLVDATPVEED